MQIPVTAAKAHLTRLTCDFRDGAICHFVPHEKNGFLPHVLQHHVLTGYSAIALLLKAILILAPTVLPVAAVYSSAITSANIIALTNVAREAVGIVGLKAQHQLTAAAVGKAEDIMAKQYFAHVGPDGKTPWDWIRGAGYDYRHAGENLALHFFTAEGAHDSWMASPAHKQNIVDPRYTDIGVAVQQGTYQGFATVAVVQMFGTPKDAVAETAEPVPTATVTEAPAVIEAPVIELPTEVKGVESENTEDTQEAPPAPSKDSLAETTSTETAGMAPAAPVAAKPSVDLSSVKVLPAPTGYAISAEVPDAVGIEAYLANDSVSLTRDAEGSWSGTLEATTVPTDAEYLFVGAQLADGQRSYSPVAMVMPSAPVAELYAGGSGTSDSVKFLGWKITGLQDVINRFYIFGLMFLAAALLTKILVKIRIQHPSVIAHTVLVIGLFAVLLKF